MSAEIFVATQDFFAGQRRVRRGETFRAGHPLLNGREKFFKLFAVDNEVEQATAAPRERRGEPTQRPYVRREKPEPEPAGGIPAGGPGDDQRPSGMSLGTHGQAVPSTLA